MALQIFGSVAGAGGGGGTGNGLPSTVVTKTAAYTAAAGNFVQASATGGGFTVTLPTSPAVGALVSVQKTDASANVVTVAPAAGGTINGDTTATIVARWAGAVLEHVGSNAWAVVSVFNSAGPPGTNGTSGTPQGIFSAGVVGSWYPVVGIPVQSQASSAAGAAGTAIVGTPYITTETITIDALGCYVGASAVGATVRLGLLTPRAANPYRLALSSVYADLLVESAAPVDASSNGAKTALLTTPLVIPAGTAFAGIAVVQGSGSLSLWAENAGGLTNTPWGQVGDAIEGGPRVGVTATGLTSGAIPSTFTPTAYRAAGIGGVVWFRRSA